MAKFQYDQSYGRILGVAYTQVYKRLGKNMKERALPITPDQFRVLTHLWQTDGLSQQEIADRTRRDRANVTRILDILEREGIVERRDHETDRRIFRIFLTAKGRDIENEAAECGRMAIEEALKGINEQDIKTCIEVLKKTIKNLT